MKDKLVEAIAEIVVNIITTLINAIFIMWFWNDGLVGAIDGVHPIDYWKAVSIYLLIYCIIKPIIKIGVNKE